MAPSITEETFREWRLTDEFAFPTFDTNYNLVSLPNSETWLISKRLIGEDACCSLRGRRRSKHYSKHLDHDEFLQALKKSVRPYMVGSSFHLRGHVAETMETFENNEKMF